MIHASMQHAMRSPLQSAMDRIGSAVWTPATLFAASEQGVWYDPSDFRTMFQDSGGTTPVTAVGQPVGRILDKSGRGNHATQATAAARPVVSARVNLLTKTEDFADAAWDSGGFRTALVAPTTGFDKVTEALAASGSIDHRVVNIAPTTLGAQYDFIFDAKPGERRRVILYHYQRAAWFDLVSGTCGASTDYPTSVTASMLMQADGSYRCQMRFTANYTGSDLVQVFVGADGQTAISNARVGDGVSGVYLDKAQFVPANSGAYQRVNTETDYDTVGFPHALDADGVDDSMAQSGGGGSTTAFMLCAAVKPEGGAASARTIWSDAGTNTGYIVRLNASNQLEFAASNNSPIATPVQAAATTATTGGTGLAAQTAYYYVVTALNALGETLKSNEQTVTTGVGTTNSNTISWGAITGATGYRIYRGTAAGAENVYYAVGGVTSYVDTGAASTDGSPPAYGSTAYVKVATTGTLDVGTQNVVTVWDDGVNLNAQINNGAVASVARPATVPAGSTTATIGKNNLAAIEFFNGLIYSLVQVKDDGGTDAERTAAKAYAAGKGGVTL